MRAGFDTAVVIVTGAASGVGRATAEALAGAGCTRLVLSDRDEDGLSRVSGGLSGSAKVEAIVGDLAELAFPEQLVGRATAAFGRVDGLVNAAGLTTRGGVVDGTHELWETLFAVNARAPFFLMQQVIKDMLARGGGGAIVNIQSVNAHCGTPELAVYSATKGALQTLTKNAANAHLKDGIRVNGINLGWALTEAEDRLHKEFYGKPDGWADEVGAALPLGRLLTPEEAARLAVYLLSPASSPLSGACIDLDQRPLGAP